MTIDEEKYKLPLKNYIPHKCEKTQIVFGNTFNLNMKHVEGWLNRYNGNYKKTAHFTIDIDGNIFNHFDPNFTSKYFKDNTLNNKSIIILLENYGWLTKNINQNTYNTWFGDIYNMQSEVVEKKWRNQKYWLVYSEKQFQSAIDLSIFLCDKFNLPKFVMAHNTKIDNIKDFNGILYKSNIEKYYTDLNPSWNFEKFKEKIENYEK